MDGNDGMEKLQMKQVMMACSGLLRAFVFFVLPSRSQQTK
jgi:hypothetical protein